MPRLRKKREEKREEKKTKGSRRGKASGVLRRRVQKKDNKNAIKVNKMRKTNRNEGQWSSDVI